MIGYCDFVKLFCVFNGANGKYLSPNACLCEAEGLANRLKSEGYFDSNNQVTPDDFLTVLSDMNDTLDYISNHV